MYLVKDWDNSIHHIFREGNSCADILAKLGANCNALFIYLIILVEFRVFYMTYMIYVDK